jgi:hypothetical protein
LPLFGEARLPQFSDALAAALGIDLSSAEQRTISLAGRPQPIVCRYAPVQIRISNGSETFEWNATVGFVAANISRSGVVLPNRWTMLVR